VASAVPATVERGGTYARAHRQVRPRHGWIARHDAIVGQVALGRPGTADEAAATVVFLASDEAACIAGQVLAVDGGMAMM
jgi:NAD(P)-dependent dehydrogenase (short-subunit alcohol dehydrogenase family)